MTKIGMQLCDREDYTPIDTTKIQTVCEHWVDYVSVRYFNVYEELALGAKEFHDESALRLLKERVPTIDGTKDHCNAQLEMHPFSLQALDAIMSERFECADRLLKDCHEAHSTQNA